MRYILRKKHRDNPRGNDTYMKITGIMPDVHNVLNISGNPYHRKEEATIFKTRVAAEQMCSLIAEDEPKWALVIEEISEETKEMSARDRVLQKLSLADDRMALINANSADHEKAGDLTAVMGNMIANVREEIRNHWKNNEVK